MRIWTGDPKFARIRIWVSALLLLAFLVFTAPLRAEAPVFPPGSRVGLAPPAGFGVSPDFTGFMDREASASIVINVMPKEAFDGIAAGLTADRLAAQGMTLLGPCDNVKTAFESRCYRITQEAGGYLFQKWFLLARIKTETAMVVATLPDVVMAEGLYSAVAIEAALSSLAYREDLAGDPVDALPFTIEEGDLLPFQRALGGSAALFAGQAAPEAPQPLWIVAASLDSRAQAREVEFDRMAFQQIAGLSEAQVTDERPFAMDRLEGHILEGTGKDEETGSDLYVFQAILVDADDKYYRLVGLAPVAAKALYRPEFLRLMQTLQPR